MYLLKFDLIIISIFKIIIMDNSFSIEEKKEILILNLLYDFCKNNNYNKSFEYLSYHLYVNGYISNKILSSNSLCSNEDLYNVYLKDSNIDILSVISNTGKSNLKLSTLSRFKSQFNNISIIGSGGFGDVYKVKNMIDESNYAVKVLNMNDIISEYYVILREVRILSKLKHNNIIGYFSSWIGVDDIKEEDMDENNSFLKLYIQMELCESTLFNYLETRQEICYKNNIHFINNISDGLIYIHSMDIVHRDIKPKNIFMLNNCLKIGDFGLSRKLIKNNKSVILKDNKNVYTSNIGSLFYSAPELLDGGIYNETVDIYSLGVIIFELFNLFNTEMEKCKLFDIFKTNPDLNNNYNKISSECITKDFSSRPKLSEIKKKINII